MSAGQFCQSDSFPGLGGGSAENNSTRTGAERREMPTPRTIAQDCKSPCCQVVAAGLHPKDVMWSSRGRTRVSCSVSDGNIVARPAWLLAGDFRNRGDYRAIWQLSGRRFPTGTGVLADPDRDRRGDDVGDSGGGARCDRDQGFPERSDPDRLSRDMRADRAIFQFHRSGLWRSPSDSAGMVRNGIGDFHVILGVVHPAGDAIDTAMPEVEVEVDSGTDNDTVVQPRLAGRLEPEMRGTLISISVRDHYVDVRTDKVRSSLLLWLSDAIDETAPIDGAQVHRSHWVAWEAVQAVERKRDKVLLRLCDGDPIPISRNCREKLEARGLI